jgi:TM2 domain-containing membrane protein YozV
MLQGRICLKLYANIAMGLVKLVICLVVIVLLVTIFLLLFVVVDWRFEFWQHDIFYLQPHFQGDIIGFKNG